MRFDDRIATVMAQPAADAVARQITWRQLVDILAQERGTYNPQDRADAFKWLEGMRGEVAPVVRASVVRAIALRVSAPDLVAYFAKDDPAIAAPLLSNAQLSAQQWQDILPAMPTASRALLRGRRDLPMGVRQALGSYGSADYALEDRHEAGAAPEAPLSIKTQAASKAEPAPNQAMKEELSPASPIAAIVERIEAFRASREAALSVAPSRAGPLAMDSFTFETDVEGVIGFVSSVPREAICGISIATAAEGWLCGVDGHAAGAFRAHSVFRNARLTVAGDGPTAGDWLIDGDPVFEPQQGKFLGYHGTARRPHSHERAESGHSASNAPPLSGVPLSPQDSDQLRQLVHELRTPLNAIQGFAEMIEKQLLGPVTPDCRARARAIMYEGRRLLTAIEDVDMTARLDGSANGGAALGINTESNTDASSLLTLIGRESADFTDMRHIHLRISRAAAEMPVKVDRPALQRLFSRLVGAMISVAEAGETIDVALTRHDTHIVLAASRPRALLGLEEHELLDPGYSVTGEWPDASLLGLGFGLRLIDRLAQAANVKFMIEPDQFSLILPAVADSAATKQEATGYYGSEEAQERAISRPSQTE